MATKSIAWNTGNGNINVEYGGNKDGTITVTSDNNNLYESRSQQIKVKTTDGSNIERTITIQQAAKVRTNISTASVTAASQTYSGSAKTPTVTVTLNGDVVPSSGYDVAYSNNTNAGTATITVTGKNDYIGTATGSFTIAQREVTLSWGTLTWTYDKATHSTTCTAGNLVTGDTCNVTLTGNSITNKGTTTVTASGLSNGNYKLPSSKTATLTINARVVTLTWGTISWTYDGSAHSTTCTAGNVISGDTCNVTLTGNSITNAGSTTVTASSLSNGNYALPSTTTNTLTISAKVVTLNWGTTSWTYDKSSHSTTCTASGLVGSDACTVTLTNNSIGANVGSTTVTASALSNSNYALPSSNTRTISIVAKTISLTWGTVTWVYDATEHGTTCTAGGVISGDTCTITLSGNSITNKGTTTVTASSLSNSNYALPSAKTNTLTISARPINITAGSTSKTYDGSALTYNSATAESAGTNRGLVSGHSMTSCIVTGTITNAGSIANVPSGAVIKSGSTDVTSNYSITYVNGTLTIAKASRTLSFVDSYVVLDTSSNVTKTATPSAGSGDGAITYSISSTTYATINSSSGKVTSKTSDGSATVTATIAEGTNYLSASDSYTLYVFATTHDFSYTGSVQSLDLIPGSYKLQCWGAQGGSNAADSSHGITSQAGGKGGYSEGVLTVSQDRTVYVFVGGQGSSTGNGGWNGGGGCENSYARYDSGGIYGTSRFACGGGATDIALTTSSMSYSSYRTNRSSASLLSRMIVAGGGSGGAMAYKKTSGSSTSKTMNWGTNSNWGSSTTSSSKIYWTSSSGGFTAKKNASWPGHNSYIYIDSSYFPCTLTFSYTISGSIGSDAGIYAYDNENLIPWTLNDRLQAISGSSGSVSVYLTDSSKPYLGFYCNDLSVGSTITVSSTEITYTTSDTIEWDYHAGWPGGGTTGGGYRSDEKGTQTSAGSGGNPTANFGNGATQDAMNWKFVSGAGGGGWYGGGTHRRDDALYGVQCSGGGSGFVNTAASAGNRPSGYTGLQLDSGSTTAGNSSFPAPSGGNETGHSGNGYARITRL